MNLKTRFGELFGAAVVAALMGCSMSLSLLGAFSVAAPPWQCILTCSLTSLFCMMLLWDKIPAIIASVCLGGGTGIFLLRQENLLLKIRGTLSALLQIIAGGEGSLNEHALVMVIFISVLMTLLAFMMTRLSGGVYPSLLLFLFVMMGGWFMEKRLEPLQLAPGLVALAALYARSHRESMNYLKAMPAALAAVLIAVLLLPAGQLTWEPLANAAQKVKDLISDYFMFTDPRTVYSVSSDGYQPQGEVLGGPAVPREADVMRVTAESELLMRGSVRRTYTGYSWVDNALNSRYLFIDPTRISLREGVFDLDKAGALVDMLSEIKVDVEMLSEGTSTLFVPHRLKSLSLPIDLVAYYNDSGEVFITRGVQAGDRYSFTAYRLDHDEKRLGELINAVPEDSDPDYGSICNSYMNIPAGLDNDVYWLTQSLIENAASPYEKALAIQKHLLSEEYTYKLNVALPPKGRDFVSYFLLDSKEGYCTYYASAMAIMARLAGLPSRYIEGYLVPEGENGETVVTGENAHAWVEIYFEGIGWIPFDATPGREQRDDSGNGSGHYAPTPTPTPTPTPSPSPTPDSGSSGEDEPEITPTPTPDPQHDMTTPTPTPPPPADDSDDEQNEPNSNWLGVLLKILLWLLLLLVIAALIYWRWMMTDPKKLSEKQKDDPTRLMLWYRTILTLMLRSGYVPDGGETPTAFAQRVIGAKAAPKQLLDLTQLVERQQYGRAETGARELKLARGVYERILANMTVKEKVSWQIYRLMHGLGNFAQIP